MARLKCVPCVVTLSCCCMLNTVYSRKYSRWWMDWIGRLTDRQKDRQMDFGLIGWVGLDDGRLIEWMDG